MASAVAITGTRQTAHRDLGWFSELFSAYLAPWATEDREFFLGGAVGIDSLALLWLAGNSASRITVVVPGTLAQQPAEARQAAERCRDRIESIVELGADELRTPAYHARNTYMVDRARMVIGFPREGPESTSGTWQTINYASSQGKPRLIVPV
ncbi:DNA-processing protein DprA [Streptomyces sp. CRN 30]|uniref:DNA-processing protein DprA n=1 Tax=Streptomyces sp. CRN 30 TaxID=3075613 RepID=UPI002A80D5FC|nr:DNA-processing protein DprA [Streptomyces sp. CRN 30]